MQGDNNSRMREIMIEKVTLNIGTGKNPEKLDKAILLLQRITNAKPIKTITNKRIPSWNLRPGLPVGCVVTVRKKNAEILLKRLLEGVENSLSKKQIGNGTFSFGIKEYIDIEGMKYDPEIKVMGLEASVALERRGFRIKRRRLKQRRIGKKHLITKEETIKFLQEKFKTRIRED
ncbi:MAG: 50S ribosomal protein L5 [Candidatus Woesearchaeota archaeon]